MNWRRALSELASKYPDKSDAFICGLRSGFEEAQIAAVAPESVGPPRIISPEFLEGHSIGGLAYSLQFPQPAQDAERTP
jgi:hypothetical protein